MSSETQLDSDIVEQLSESTRGPVIEPGDSEYADARTVWNGMVDKYPDAILRASGTADVMNAVRIAGSADALLSVKGGGHNFAGKAVCDGGIMIDLSPMNHVRVDPASQTARVGPGATWGDFDHEAQAHGLATTGGVDSRTGVAGLTLGGGIGWLARAHGLAIDNLLAADVVTANGELVHASPEQHPELFWGIRGGGGNFGVVTSFKYELHEVGPEVLTAQVFHPREDARSVLQHYREFLSEAPNEVGCYAFLLHVPPEPPFPSDYHGEDTAAIVACYVGDPAEGEAALEPLTEFGDPFLSVLDTMPYTALQSNFDDGYPEGDRYYAKSAYLEALSDECIDVVLEHSDPMPGPYTAVFFEGMGGAVSEVSPDATAYPHRSAAFNLGINAGWVDSANDEEIIAWARDFHEAVAAHATGGVYANYLDRDDDERVPDAFGGNYERLRELKAEWDPDDLFTLTQHIPPAE